MRLRTLLATGSAVALACVTAAALPAQAHTTPHPARLTELNDSGVTGHVNVLQKHGQVRVNLTGHGLEAGQVHAQHIHGFAGSDQEARCPTLDLDQDGDGLISFSEGLPAYGPVAITLGADEPAGDAVSYSRAFTETDAGEPVSELGELSDYVVIVHGRTVGGEYVPSLPVACAELNTAGQG